MSRVVVDCPPARGGLATFLGSRVAAVRVDLGAGWRGPLDGHTDAELDVITHRMRRTRELRQAQMERLRLRPKPE